MRAGGLGGLAGELDGGRPKHGSQPGHDQALLDGDAGASDDEDDHEQEDLPEECKHDPERVTEWVLGNEIARLLDIGANEQCRGATVAPGLQRQWQPLQHIMAALGGAGTIDTQRAYVYDWGRYVMFMHGPGAIDIADTTWPPSREQWMDFMSSARAQVASYKRFCTLIGNVCHVGVAYWVRKQHVPDEAAVDPRKLYKSDTHTMKVMLRREFGVGVRQVMGVTMTEARNGPQFVEKRSVLGCNMAVAWTIGTVLGGRRPRSVAAVQLKDLTLVACRACIGGSNVMVPGIRSLVWREEKTFHYAGARESSDMYDGLSEPDETVLQMRPAYWIYRLLVLRGVFERLDPLSAPGVREHQVLHIKPEAKDYYLLCEATADDWVDTLPISVATLGRYTRTVLKRMGSPQRGYSAHRRGCVTRACILNILQNRGSGLSEDTLMAIARWGGWECVTGVMTVMKVYAARIIDSYLNGAVLGLGHRAAQVDWEARLAEYTSHRCECATDVRDASHMTGQPLLVRHRVRHHVAVVAVRHELNAAVAKLLQAAAMDITIMPILRFREARDVYVCAMASLDGAGGRGAQCKVQAEVVHVLWARRATVHKAACTQVWRDMLNEFRVVFVGEGANMDKVFSRVRGALVGRLPWGGGGVQPVSVWSNSSIFFS